MIEPMPIRILADDANQRGDLFNRLVKDLFHSLGYDPIRVNVHKTVTSHLFRPSFRVANPT